MCLQEKFGGFRESHKSPILGIIAIFEPKQGFFGQHGSWMNPCSFMTQGTRGATNYTVIAQELLSRSEKVICNTSSTKEQ